MSWSSIAIEIEREAKYLAPRLSSLDDYVFSWHEDEVPEPSDNDKVFPWMYSCLRLVGKTLLAPDIGTRTLYKSKRRFVDGPGLANWMVPNDRGYKV